MPPFPKNQPVKKTGAKSSTKKTSVRYGYVFNVMSDDHPGIVAAVSTAVAEMKGNIEACSQTVLDGYFTLIMTMTLAKNRPAEEVERELASADGLADCRIMVRRGEMRLAEPSSERPDTFVITASGRDRTGIVAEFSRYLAEREVNIIDLFGDRTDDGEFVLISQVEVDARHDIRNLQFDLEEIGRSLGFSVKLQHNNIFVATNQLRVL